MITNYQNYISGWIGFTFALISFILSFVTLIIIYEMCRETESSKKGSVNIVLRNSETQNPAHAQNERALSVEPYLASDAQKTDFNSATTISRGRSKSGHTKFNGYLLIILSMTCCQILYDLNYMIGITSTYDGCVAWHFLDFLGGLSVPLWTNILSFIVYYIVTYIKSLVCSISKYLFLRRVHLRFNRYFLLGHIWKLSLLLLYCGRVAARIFHFNGVNGQCNSSNR